MALAMLQYIITFFLGGLVTTAIVYFEATGLPIISRLAALFPVFTWLSYLFIGSIKGAQEVSSHALFVALGTIFCWIPYMLVLAYLAPKIGTLWAVLAGIAVFIVLALIFIKVY